MLVGYRTGMTLRCSSFVDEPLPGTAAQERGWLCIENNAGWGRDPLSGETFDGATGAAVAEFAKRNNLRVLLIRRPGRAGEFRADKRVYIARSTPGECALRLHTVRDYAEIPALDPDGGEPAEPIALVCTNGKRDVCCAVQGRPVAASLAGCYADPVVWECSHTGGHRFAPVLIVLPTGYTYGRVNGERAKAALDAARAGMVAVDGLRGRSTEGAVGQVAEVAVRQLLGVVGADVLRVQSSGDSASVRHRDGRQWRVEVTSEPLEPRIASCGKEPSSPMSWRVTSLTAV